MNQRIFALFCFLLLLMVGTVSAGEYTLISPATLDGFLQYDVDGSWASMRGATGQDLSLDNNYDNIYTLASSIDQVISQHRRGPYNFNASETPDTATITGGTVTVYAVDKSNGLGTCAASLIYFSPASETTFAAGDYDNTNFTRVANDIPYASFNTGGMNNFTLNALGINSISKTGMTHFLFTHSCDVDNTGITWASGAYSGFYLSEIVNPAFLTTIYTTGAPPDTTPPASITGLTNITTCQNITWQWTNPTDADFNHTMIWKNNVFQYNLTNVTTSDLWESLVENTEYTFSGKTVDITGNENITFVNLTSTTDACPVPTTEPTTTATTAPPTTTTASPTPTPTPTPLEGCTYFNLTGVIFGENSTDWNVTEGLNTWGVSTFNITQGNVSWWICRATPTTTAPPIWHPVINPSTDIKTDWLGLLWSWWWLPILILIMILLFRRK